MAGRQGILCGRNVIKSFRKFSSSMLKVSVSDESNVVTVTMNKPPVNTMDLEFCTDFCKILTELEKSKPQGMILTSSLEKVFSAGLDFAELLKPDKKRFRQFWDALLHVWIKLYGSSFPTVAIINGHSPAGGCLLSLCCEYRVMVDNYKLGLNETQLGITVPDWLSKAMSNCIGARNTELALTSGRLFSTKEALDINLIDEIAADKEDAMKKTLKFLEVFKATSPMARAYIKNKLRGPAIEQKEVKIDIELNLKLIDRMFLVELDGQWIVKVDMFLHVVGMLHVVSDVGD
ncbi:hypothetical protein FQA39_LY01875 [Lamprigera yunnana]|nr:hypothetical protein FQA39_LY01875 [Lamprigera yunnana]